MNYAANQSESGRPGVSAAALQHRLQQGMHHRAASERVPNGAPPGYGGSAARKNIISAFGQGDSSNWTGVSGGGLAGFDGAGSGVQVNLPIDLTSQSSMVHRMMDREKNDVDPRDVHKLLPETMMASDSLGLDSELIHGTINQVIHDIMDAQVVQEMDDPSCRQRKTIHRGSDEAHRFADAQVSQLTRLIATSGLESVDIGHGGMSSPECISPLQSIRNGKSSMRLSPTPPHLPPRPRSVQGLRTTYSASSPVPGKPPATAPVTGYPAAPALGIVHPLNTGRLSPIAPSRTQSPSLLRRSTIPSGNQLAYPDGPSSQQSARFGAINQGNQVAAMGKLPAQHLAYSDAPMGLYTNVDRRTSSRMSCRSPIAESMYESPHGDELPPRVIAMSPDMRGPLSPLPGQLGDVADLLNSELDPNASEDAKGKAARKFRSLEAALAWCHVQHSQKHVPVVPKDDVKKLVEFQLKNGKPIRAPWYRPTRSEDGDEEEREDPEEPTSEESDSGSIPQQPIETTPSKATVAQIIPETEILTENHQAPPMEHEMRKASKVMSMQPPQRPERPRCESAPLVRSWKQQPRHSNPNRRPTSQSGNVKPLGTGFFCPPGFELPAASPTAH